MKDNSCQRCSAFRIITVTGKCGDLAGVSYGEHHSDGYVPYGLNIGGGDYVEFKLCLDCGQQQGEFPVSPEAVIQAFQAVTS
jgi:hypothetical protein